MKDTDNNLSISDSTLQSLKDAQKSSQRFAEKFAEVVTKIPKFNPPKIPQIPIFLKEQEPIEYVDPNLVREQNEWERHKEIIDIQNALLGVQSDLLDEQKSNTKFTKIVLGLTVLGIIISAVSLFH